MGVGCVAKMRCIGFDPGLRKTGWGVIDILDSKISHVANGVCNVANGVSTSETGFAASQMPFATAAAKTGDVALASKPKATVFALSDCVVARPIL